MARTVLDKGATSRFAKHAFLDMHNFIQVTHPQAPRIVQHHPRIVLLLQLTQMMSRQPTVMPMARIVQEATRVLPRLTLSKLTSMRVLAHESLRHLFCSCCMYVIQFWKGLVWHILQPFRFVAISLGPDDRCIWKAKYVPRTHALYELLQRIFRPGSSVLAQTRTLAMAHQVRSRRNQIE